MSQIGRFDARLRSLGIPIHGISGSGPNCRIDFRSEATGAQKDQAKTEAASFDWGQRTLKSKSQLRSEYNALSDADKAKLKEELVLDLLFDRLVSDPDWAVRLGVKITGD